jgi:tricorn protease-like protein
MAEPEAVQQDLWNDLQPLLDQELNRLPDKYRVPVILCELEGKTRKEVARELGLPEGTVGSRLARARAMLAKRLTRRGLAVGGGSLATVLAQKAAACVPTAVVSSTLKAASLFAAGQRAASGAISAKVAALVEGVLKTMLLAKLKTATTVLLMVGLLSTGIGFWLHSTWGETPAVAQGERIEKTPRTTAKPAPREPARRPVKGTWTERLVLKPHFTRADQIFCAAISPDGKMIAIGLTSGLKIFDAKTGRERISHSGLKVTCTLAFSPNGKILATGHLDGGTVNLLDLTTGKVLAALKAASTVHCLAFSPDGKTLALGEKTLSLWELATKKQVRQFASSGKRAQGVYSVAFSPDGKKLASAEGSDKTVKVWEVSSGKEVATLTGHREYCIAVAISPDGKTLASSGGDREVKLWDMATLKERATLKGPVAAFHGLAFSPGGMLASAGGKEKTVALWDVATGKELATLTEHTKQVWSVAFSPDGKTLVTAGDDAVRVWEATKPDARKRP